MDRSEIWDGREDKGWQQESYQVKKRSYVNEMARDASGADDLYGHIPNLAATTATSDNTSAYLDTSEARILQPCGGNRFFGPRFYIGSKTNVDE